MKDEKTLYKGLSLFLVTILLVNAFVVFVSEYTRPHVEIPLIVAIDDAGNRMVFYLNFFVAFSLCTIFLYISFFVPEYYTRNICLVAGFISAILGVYILDDLLTIKLSVYSAYAVTLILTCPKPVNIPATAVAIALFVFFECHPSFMGKVPVTNAYNRPEFSDMISFLAYMLLVAFCTVLIRLLFERHLFEREIIRHHDFVGKKMVIFNHRLQELAKQRGEEAVKEDRLRFTRDLHDSCGYAFTNIIMTSDAAVSQGRIDPAHSQEIFQRIRTLASNGLNDTRETLHLIRRIMEPYAKTIETIYQIKLIIEEVTGISVDIEWGNMRYEYGPAVNKVITRIIQEAFTNAIRHGMATHMMIQFWEFSENLSMTVTDNGIGAATIVKGIGLAGMEERLEAIGGKLELSLPPEGGFRLRITIPVVEQRNGGA
jgi:signal transduction histidine kinase